MVLSVELHFDLTIRCLGNWVRSYGFVFTVLKIRGVVSRNVFKHSRKTVTKASKDCMRSPDNEWPRGKGKYVIISSPCLDRAETRALGGMCKLSEDSNSPLSSLPAVKHSDANNESLPPPWM